MCIYDQLTDLADVCNYYIHIYIQTSLILQQHRNVTVGLLSRFAPMAKSILQQASKCQKVLCVMSFFEGQRVETDALKITLSTAGRLIFTPIMFN